jgi:cytoskeletal protein CcmA (bactofilin family)
LGYEAIKELGTNAETPAEQALIGISLTVCGDITSAEDLSIRGVVEGNTLAPEHVVTIHREGYVKGNVFGRTIIVKGRMRGNLYADETVMMNSSADVRGKIFASRVSLEEGGRYKGRINMDAKARRGAVARTKARKER